ncbi:MAG: peptidase C39 family protein [Planctomycetota bacterium]|nr:peptidase C39 family protein [Planctomycetota bacterium]
MVIRRPHLVLWRGRATEGVASPEYVVAPFDRAVLSWNASGPCICELEANGERHCMGLWGGKPRSRATAFVATDTLTCPRIPRRPRAWGKVLAVPEHSQFSEKKDARRICSPTAVAMVLEYHGVRKSTRAVARGVYDHAAKIYGNWPFNTAYAHSVSGLETFVQRGTGIEDLEKEIAARRPAIVSHKWRTGELDGAPLPASDGHLIVVVGFTENGDVVVNDPAGQPGAVRRVYKRRQIERTWLERGDGIMYVMRKT